MNSYAAFRSAAELPDYDYQPPTVRVLWEKTHIARRAHSCDGCGEEIAPGVRYKSAGIIIDGDFQAQKTHAERCPRWAARDAQERAELAAQFEADRERYFPGNSEPADARAEGPAPSPDAEVGPGRNPIEPVKTEEKL